MGEQLNLFGGPKVKFNMNCSYIHVDFVEGSIWDIYAELRYYYIIKINNRQYTVLKERCEKV